jgi:hypothetical protein
MLKHRKDPGTTDRKDIATMRKALVLVGITVMLLVIAPSAADAAGPFCLSTEPFSDTFIWFLSSSGGNQVVGSGRDLAGDRAQTVAGFISGNILTVGFTTYAGGAGAVPVTGGGTINLGTGRGPGACFAPDFASCGDFTFVSITCPPGAIADSGADAGLPAGRAQGITP